MNKAVHLLSSPKWARSFLVGTLYMLWNIFSGSDLMVTDRRRAMLLSLRGAFKTFTNAATSAYQNNPAKQPCE